MSQQKDMQDKVSSDSKSLNNKGSGKEQPKPNADKPAKSSNKNQPKTKDSHRYQSKLSAPLKNFSRMVKKPLIKEAVKEVTAGGIVYRINKDSIIEILLAQDSRDRWTIPKGHVEPGEITSETAEREIREETDLQEMKVYDHLGKSTFQYRRLNTLVLMTMHIFLVEGKGKTDDVRKVDPWMKDLGWFDFSKALDMIAYEAIETLMLVGLRKVRERYPGAKISS
ncbi:NUDIX domain-containing protein [Candidatus Saccharibacteria bacterium]|jgi:ADP-ribose pyrophosphatase YjhB (NUDIX family)|nr:NUDIX domain-containing protein [Candidatus Saccharibacteria bacterium]